jgi:hypothetical protein
LAIFGVVDKKKKNRKSDCSNRASSSVWRRHIADTEHDYITVLSVEDDGSVAFGALVNLSDVAARGNNEDDGVKVLYMRDRGAVSFDGSVVIDRPGNKGATAQSCSGNLTATFGEKIVDTYFKNSTFAFVVRKSELFFFGKSSKSAFRGCIACFTGVISKRVPWLLLNRHVRGSLFS